MYTDDHCGRYVGLLERPAPLRYSLAVACEDDCFGRVRWNVHRDLPSPVVLERLSGKLSRDYAGGLGGGSVGSSWRAVDVTTWLLHVLPSFIELWPPRFRRPVYSWRTSCPAPCPPRQA